MVREDVSPHRVGLTRTAAPRSDGRRPDAAVPTVVHAEPPAPSPPDPDVPHRSFVPRALAVLAVSFALSACTTLSAVTGGPTRTLSFDGPEDGALLNADDVAATTFVASAEEEDASLEDLVFTVDGQDVSDEVEISGTTAVYDPDHLEDGERLVTVSSVPPPDDADGDGDDAEEGAAEPAAEAEEPVEPELLHQWSIRVDATPPEIELTSPDGAVVAGEELVVAGTTEGGATVEIGGQSVEAAEDGSFEVSLPEAPDGALEIVATDAAGNRSDDEVTLVTVPSRAVADEIRTVHVSFCGWASPALKDPIMAQAEQGLITAVQLDLKDETGKVGYDTQVEFAERIGSNTPDCRIDLEAAIEELHALGLPVIGRIVAFADPVLAPWAFANGEPDMAMQTEGGELYTGRYAGFANFAHPEVLEYNLDLAEEAAAMGVDHILWDYIRKPDGDGARFPGLEGDPEDAIVEFTQMANERIAPYGTLHGASVYGVSADRPHEVAQNIPRMAEHLDYVAPMLYPSHWGPGEYGVADPLRQPYDMLTSSLEVFQEAVEGTDARVIPWLEDSNYPVSLGYPDRAEYVREQIRATYDAGIPEWLLWDSAVRYTEAAMTQPDGD